MKIFQGKYIGFLIILAVIIRFMMIGVEIFTSSSTNEAHAQQELKKIDVKKAQSNVLDFEVLKSFENRKDELDKFEEKLKKKEEQLSTLKVNIETRMEQFVKIRLELEKLVKTRKDLSEKSLKHLVKVYESMKPDSAAPLIEQLDRGITIAILSRMKGKNVGKILSKVNPDIASTISEQIARRK